MFQGSCYKQEPSGLGPWVIPNMWPLTGKSGQALRALVGGSFPSSTVPRPGKYQNTEKVLDWGARESCNRIICVFISLSLFRSLLRCRSTPLRILCCGGACSTSWWHSTDVLSSCFTLDITYPLLQQTSPWAWGVQPSCHDSSCSVSPQHSTHWPALMAKTGTKRGSDASYSGLPVDNLHTGFHVGLEPSYPPLLLRTPVL